MVAKTSTDTTKSRSAIRKPKEERESFSDTFVRPGKRSLTCKDVIGIIKQTPEEARELAQRVRAAHERLGHGLERRKAVVRTRLMSFD